MASDMWRSAGKHRCGSSKHSPGCAGGSRRILGVNIRIGQAAHGPKLLDEHEGKGRTRFMQSATVSPILLALENWIQAQLWISFHSGLEADVSDSGGGLSIL